MIANVDKSEHFSQNRVVEYNPFGFKLNLFTEKPVNYDSWENDWENFNQQLI